MINVTVILPNKKRGKVQVDPSASIEEVKNTIVKDLNLGKPENYLLSIVHASEDRPIGGAKLQDGDIVYVLDARDIKGASVVFDPKSFQ